MALPDAKQLERYAHSNKGACRNWPVVVLDIGIATKKDRAIQVSVKPKRM